MLIECLVCVKLSSGHRSLFGHCISKEKQRQKSIKYLEKANEDRLQIRLQLSKLKRNKCTNVFIKFYEYSKNFPYLIDIEVQEVFFFLVGLQMWTQRVR